MKHDEKERDAMQDFVSVVLVELEAKVAASGLCGPCLQRTMGAILIADYLRRFDSFDAALLEAGRIIADAINTARDMRDDDEAQTLH